MFTGSNPTWMTFLIALLLTVSGGCKGHWIGRKAPSRFQLYYFECKDRLDCFVGGTDIVPLVCGSDESTAERLRSARSAALRALDAERAGDEQALDEYFASAVQAWNAWTNAQGSPKESAQAREIYHASLSKMLELAVRCGRLECGRGIRITFQGRKQFIPLVTHGFVWQSEDFQQLVVVDRWNRSVPAKELDKS